MSDSAHPPTSPLPDVPARLASLGFRGVNPSGMPAILPPLVSVAAGPFLMGSAESDPQAYYFERPQHRVELPAFQIGKYPVTVAEYALAVRAGVVGEAAALEFKLADTIVWPAVTWPEQLRRLEHPVIAVSWQDASAYVAWLRDVTGEAGWRLPSEAQWEKAARWDGARHISLLYPWGDTFDPTRCNPYVRGSLLTKPVGSYPASDAQRSGASPAGVEDMVGNGWEWTSTLHSFYPYSATDGREDQERIGYRVARGGSVGATAKSARAADRVSSECDSHKSINGFRLALSPVGT